MANVTFFGGPWSGKTLDFPFAVAPGEFRLTRIRMPEYNDDDGFMRIHRYVPWIDAAYYAGPEVYPERYIAGSKPVNPWAAWRK